MSREKSRAGSKGGVWRGRPTAPGGRSELPDLPTRARKVHRFGYAFSAEATELSEPRPLAAVFSCWLEWGERQIPLPEGEHNSSRDPGALVRITTPWVSRRHTQIQVHGRPGGSRGPRE